MGKAASKRRTKAWRLKTVACPNCSNPRVDMQVTDTWMRRKYYCKSCKSRVA